MSEKGAVLFDYVGSQMHLSGKCENCGKVDIIRVVRAKDTPVCVGICQYCDSLYFLTDFPKEFFEGLTYAEEGSYVHPMSDHVITIPWLVPVVVPLCYALLLYVSSPPAAWVFYIFLLGFPVTLGIYLSYSRARYDLRLRIGWLTSSLVAGVSFVSLDQLFGQSLQYNLLLSLVVLVNALVSTQVFSSRKPYVPPLSPENEDLIQGAFQILQDMSE